MEEKSNLLKEISDVAQATIAEFPGTIVARLDNELDDFSCDDLDALEEEYEAYAAECNAAMRLTLSRIENLSEAIDRAGKRNPFDRIEHRLKSFKSVRGKCKARGYVFSMEDIRDKVKDIAGIRIITKYRDEVEKVTNMVAQIPGVNVVILKDYVANPKKNGYQSMHLGCQVEIYDPFKGSQLVPLEIQIRSKSMNLWATLEHDLRYKNANPSPEVEEKFRKISKSLKEFDEEVIRLRDYEEAEAKSADILGKIHDLSSSLPRLGELLE